MQDMMNGSLEAKKEAVGVEVLKKPSFMDEPLETLSEEQVKMVKDFEKRLKVTRSPPSFYHYALPKVEIRSKLAALWGN